MFITLNGGVPVLCTGPDWATINTRAAAGSIGLYGGQYVNSAVANMTARISNSATISVPQYQATYVGTIITDAAGKLNFVYGGLASGGQMGIFYVWNYYNRVMVGTYNFDTGAPYSYTGAAGTWRIARNSSQNAIYYVIGVIEDPVQTWYQQFDTCVSTGAYVLAGVAFNSTTVNTSSGFLYSNSGSLRGVVSAWWTAIANPIGLNYVAAIEQGDGVFANTFGTFGGNQLNLNYPM